MVRQPNQPSNRNAEAEKTVFDNLDLESADLGVERDDDLGLDDEEPRKPVAFEGDSEGDDEEDDPFTLTEDDQPQKREGLDDLRVSHTKKQVHSKAKFTADKNGNLVNAKGEIVARAGVQARLYTSREKVKDEARAAQAQVNESAQRLTRATNVIRDLYTENQAHKAKEAKLKELGFTAEEQVEAMSLYSALKKDRAGTLKKLLTRAAADGTVLDNLGPGGIDPKALMDAVRDEIARGVKPVVDRNTTEEAQRAQDAARQKDLDDTKAEVNAFFERNPAALPYVPVFQRVLADPRYKGLHIAEVWAMIVQREKNRTPPGSRRQTPGTGRIPNGRQAPPSGNGGEMASVNESYDSILRSVMADAGLNR